MRCYVNKETGAIVKVASELSGAWKPYCESTDIAENESIDEEMPAEAECEEFTACEIEEALEAEAPEEPKKKSTRKKIAKKEEE